MPAGGSPGHILQFLAQIVRFLPGPMPKLPGGAFDMGLHMLRKGAALQQPDEEEEAVDPHFFLSFASSAKACEDGAR